MKTVIRMLLMLVVSVAVSLVVSAQEQEKEIPGKKIFTENKCQSCHSVEAVGIKKKPNQKPPDLSTVGSERKADVIAAFLKKKETLNNAKHMVSFKGSDEDLGVLSTWLESLKGDSAKTGN
ncbi:MAG TPA: cytochrome c [Bacteroidota bacterium]